MKAYLFVVCLGVFAVMALSNAIVPVLPAFATGPAWEGAIYAAYFLGAFLSTLPGGILSDRYGRTPIIRAGLALTVASGALLFSTTGQLPVLVLRLVEGVGAGLFIAAGMSYVNTQPDHTRLSGYYLAMLNFGLVIGLAASGWLAIRFVQPALGIGVFTVLSLAALVSSVFIGETLRPVHSPEAGFRETGECNRGLQLREIVALSISHCPLWYSAIILVGITGAVTSLYPSFSGEPADVLGLWIAGMSVTTIFTVLVFSRFSVPALPAIRWSAVLMIGGVILTYKSPLGFVVLGALAGIVMVAQMTVLAKEEHQGCIMGLFSTSSYLGMTILPFIAGIIATVAGFFDAFLFTAILGATVALLL